MVEYSFMLKHPPNFLEKIYIVGQYLLCSMYLLLQEFFNHQDTKESLTTDDKIPQCHRLFERNTG